MAEIQCQHEAKDRRLVDRCLQQQRDIETITKINQEKEKALLEKKQAMREKRRMETQM
jgi:hypothetical protein